MTEHGERGLIRPRGEELEHVLDDRGDHDAVVLLGEFKRLADEQQRIAERFTGQARQAFAYIAAFFTVAQAAAIATIGQKGGAGALKYWILGIAIGAAVGVLGTGLLAIWVEFVRRYDGVGVEDVIAASDEADREDVSIELVLAKDFEAEVKNGYDVVTVKRVWLRITQGTAAFTVLLVGGELIVALAARI
jgi:hypothetical protein